MRGLTGWASVHVLADALKTENLAPTPKNAEIALKSADVPTLSQKYGLPAIDFRKPGCRGR
jgi:hypothetical protein